MVVRYARSGKGGNPQQELPELFTGARPEGDGCELTLFETPYVDRRAPEYTCREVCDLVTVDCWTISRRVKGDGRADEPLACVFQLLKQRKSAVGLYHWARDVILAMLPEALLAIGAKHVVRYLKLWRLPFAVRTAGCGFLRVGLLDFL